MSEIELLDKIIKKIDSWAVVEGLTDLFNDVKKIKGDQTETNEYLRKINKNLEKLIYLKKKQLGSEKHEKKPV